MSIEQRELGRTGVRVSAIGLGCVTFGREIDEAASERVLIRAAESGINFLDTAESYGDGASERILGRLLRRLDLRGRFILCTKVGFNLARQRILEVAEQSLAHLGTERVDLYLLHNYDEKHPLEESLEALQILLDRGRTRFIGCSNFSPERLSRALEIQERNGWTQFSVIEPMYNLVARGFERELRGMCERLGLGVLAYSPLGAGFLTGKYQMEGALPAGTRFDIKPGHRRHYFFPSAFAFIETLKAEAAAAGVPVACLALAWVLSRPGVSTMLFGARTPEHVDQAVRALSMRAELSAPLDRLTAATEGFIQHAQG